MDFFNILLLNTVAMIAIQERKDLLAASVYGELTLADYREFERAATTELKTVPKIKLLFDLARMTGYTLDVAWEEIRFTRSHAHAFRRIAIVTPERFGPWLGWVSAAFTDAEVMLFEDAPAAEAWLEGK